MKDVDQTALQSAVIAASAALITAELTAIRRVLVQTGQDAVVAANIGNPYEETSLEAFDKINREAERFTADALKDLLRCQTGKNNL